MGRKSTNKANYLTVQELSAIVEKSKQSIYRRMKPNNPFWKYVNTFDGVKMVHKSAVSEVYGIDYAFIAYDDGNVENESTDLRPTDPLIKLLNDQITQKDKQIADMQRTIDNLHEALNAEQLLNGQNTLRIQELTALITNKQAGAAPGADQDTRQTGTDQVQHSARFTETDKAGADKAQPDEQQQAEQEPGKEQSIWQRIRAAIGF